MQSATADKAGFEAGKKGKAGETHELSILCVEDNPYGRVVVSTIVAELGHRVYFAASGEAALAAFARQSFALVLMDVTLSGMDGIETTRRIRALPGGKGKTPIIGLSARNTAADEANARAAGMNAYLIKPMSPQILEGTIADVLGKSTG